MKISALDEYVIRFCLRLASCGEDAMTAQQVAEAEDVSPQYARKVLGLLARNRLIESVRGKQGGYRLPKATKALPVGDIVKSVYPQQSQLCNYCDKFSGREADCIHHEECSVRPVWKAVSQAVEGVLAKITLVDLLQTEDMVGHQLQIKPDPSH